MWEEMKNFLQNFIQIFLPPPQHVRTQNQQYEEVLAEIRQIEEFPLRYYRKVILNSGSNPIDVKLLKLDPISLIFFALSPM